MFYRKIVSAMCLGVALFGAMICSAQEITVAAAADL